MSSGLPHMVPTAEMKALAYTHGFGQIQKGCRDFVNEYAERVCEPALRRAMLQADVQKKSSLTKEHAQKALDQTTGVPKGSW